MHPSALFRETDPTRLLSCIAAYPLGLVTVHGDAAPLAAHTPVIARMDAAGPVLRFHLSATNRVTARLLDGAPALIVFTGANGYISPDWYGAVPDQVPTWNYLSVEAEGVPAVADAGQLLDDLSAEFESRLLPKPPWTRAKMAPAAFDRMVRAIRAFEMTPARFEGTAKLGQNKSAEMRAGAIEALEALPDGAAIAAAMRGRVQ